MSQLCEERQFLEVSQPVDFLLSSFEIDIPTSNTDIGGIENVVFERFDHCIRLVTYQDNYTETHRLDRLVKTWRLQRQ